MTAQTTLMIPQTTQSSALQKKYCKALLKTSPGLGVKAGEIADTLADSGLPSTLAVALLQTAYSPTVANGSGQSTRLKWFSQALIHRYGDRLEKARDNIGYLRIILGELEEIVDMREKVNEMDSGISFEVSFLLSGLGYTAESIGEMVDSMRCSRGLALSRIKKAAMMVESGEACTVEGALEHLGFV